MYSCEINGSHELCEKSPQIYETKLKIKCLVLFAREEMWKGVIAINQGALPPTSDTPTKCHFLLLLSCLPFFSQKSKWDKKRILTRNQRSLSTMLIKKKNLGNQNFVIILEYNCKGPVTLLWIDRGPFSSICLHICALHQLDGEIDPYCIRKQDR